MGQGLEPLTADLCLSSRSQPPQLPSRADFFEQSKKRNVFRASTEVTTTTASSTKAAAAPRVRRGHPTVKPLPAGHHRRWHQTTPRRISARVRRLSARVHLVTVPAKPTGTCQQKQQRWWPQRGQLKGDTRSTLSSMLPDFPSNANTMEFG